MPVLRRAQQWGRGSKGRCGSAAEKVWGQVITSTLPRATSQLASILEFFTNCWPVQNRICSWYFWEMKAAAKVQLPAPFSFCCLQFPFAVAGLAARGSVWGWEMVGGMGLSFLAVKNNTFIWWADTEQEEEERSKMKLWGWPGKLCLKNQFKGQMLLSKRGITAWCGRAGRNQWKEPAQASCEQTLQ